MTSAATDILVGSFSLLLGVIVGIALPSDNGARMKEKGVSARPTTTRLESDRALVMSGENSRDPWNLSFREGFDENNQFADYELSILELPQAYLDTLKIDAFDTSDPRNVNLSKEVVEIARLSDKESSAANDCLSEFIDEFLSLEFQNGFIVDETAKTTSVEVKDFSAEAGELLSELKSSLSKSIGKKKARLVLQLANQDVMEYTNDLGKRTPKFFLESLPGGRMMVERSYADELNTSRYIFNAETHPDRRYERLFSFPKN